MKRYPIGIQTFENIREGDYLYVDIWTVSMNLTHDFAGGPISCLQERTNDAASIDFNHF